MKIQLTIRDTKAIEKGMKKYNTDTKGLLEIVNTWEQNEQVKLFAQKIKKYLEWGM